jgi:hypothetical protein
MPLNILIPAGIALILIIVLIRLYPHLHMLFSKLVFGKYSSRYVATCKGYTGQSPYPYCIKDDFINHIAGFYNQNGKFEKYDSKREILFLDTPFGCTFKKVLKKQHKPFCINAIRYKAIDLKVFGYKDQMLASEMKKYFFFIDGEFALGQMTFKNPTPENMREIIAVMGKKYLDNPKLSANNFIINGSNHTQLLCEYNGFHLSVSYISRTHGHINEALDAYWESSTKINIGKQSSFEAELMEKL